MSVCRRLLSPICIRNTVFKNRIVATTSEPHYLSGPETYPNDAVLDHYRRKAKGAGLVIVTGFGEIGDTKKYPPFLPMTQFPDYDLFDLRNANQFIRLTDTIHYYQSAACAALDFIYGPREFTELGEIKKIVHVENVDEMSTEEIDNVVLWLTRQAAAAKRVGFDMVSIHCAYGRTLLAKTVSPLYNHRTDAFGGDAAHRAEVVRRVCGSIKDICGQDFLIHLEISGEEEEGGNTVDDTIAVLRALDGLVDIVEIRGCNADVSHPTGFEAETPMLETTMRIKAAGLSAAIENVGGFFYPETCEKAIAEDGLDFVGMARAWICNPNYGELLYEGKYDEIVPCIRCNKCHTYSLMPPFRSACSVNPWLGLEADADKLTFASEPKKIAIVGGGPAGMYAAVRSADRGNEVTLFEASDALGGQLRHADAVPFKWPLRDFKNYLIRQVEKRDRIHVALNHPVTPEELKAAGFDAVFAGIGSEPVIPPIPGLEVYGIPATDLFGTCGASKEGLSADKVLSGERIAVIGGGEIGVEIGMYLAGKGHLVTVLEMKDKVAADSNPIHYRDNFENAFTHTPGLDMIVNAQVTSVEADQVCYTDLVSGELKTLETDGIVIAAGMRARKEAAMAYADSAPGFALIGDVADPVNNLIFTLESAAAAAGRF